MMTTAPKTPTIRDARRIARTTCGQELAGITRYDTGLCHWVYRCTTCTDDTFVLRIGHSQNNRYIEGGITISRLLANHSLPVARVLDGNPHPGDGELPWMTVHHLPGDDLGDVYADLTTADKKQLARRVVQIQRTVARLASPNHFGYVHNPTASAQFRTWDQFVDRLVTRSLTWLAETDVDADAESTLVKRRLEQFRPILRNIGPTPFLDDLTTKNVLVHRGNLSGIIDVDELCFGDPLIWVGLTRMSLLNAGHDADYTQFLLDELDADDADRQRCDFYTGLFAFVFLSEQGMGFNSPDGTVDPRQIARLKTMLRDMFR